MTVRTSAAGASSAASALALALLAGPWDAPAMERRAATAIGRARPPRWIHRLVAQVLTAHPLPPQDAARALTRTVSESPAWRAGRQSRQPIHAVHWHPGQSAMGPTPWPVAEIPDLGALARLLDLDIGELQWFADVRGMERAAAEPLRHYRWSVRAKRDGVRLLAAPKPRLKEIQRRLLRHVLLPIPLHDAAHGGVRGRAVRTAVAPHTGSAVVIRADLEAFFASIHAGRVYGVLRTAGYPEPVAHAITGLCTTVVPRAVWAAVPVGGDVDRHRRLGERLGQPHLPQGAPSSPALANLVAFSLDRRLAGLARSFEATYTRYVDDLTFSGGAHLRAGRAAFVEQLTVIARDEALRLVEAKTVVLGSAGRQALLGAVINDHPTLSRPERDALRAVLHNCATKGWRSQTRGRDDFSAHLLGRIGHAAGLDPVLGARLRASYDRIDWT